MVAASQMLRSAHMTQARQLWLDFEPLEARDQPSAGLVDLGAAAQFGVLGLEHAQITNDGATVTGDAGVSRSGHIHNGARGTISGHVDEFAVGQYSGRGHAGSVLADSAAMNKVDADALGTSEAAEFLAPTQSLQSINAPQTIVGNGGLNVISIHGSINASLTLSGGASDVFVVNVRGGLHLRAHSTLGLAGGVTANRVIYNFINGQGSTSSGYGGDVTTNHVTFAFIKDRRSNSAGRTCQADGESDNDQNGGSDDRFIGNQILVTTGKGCVINGTLLGPKAWFDIGGVVNGEIIGGRAIWLQEGAVINAVPFTGVEPAASVSGTVFDDGSRDGVKDPGEPGIAGVTVSLTGTDSAGHLVSVTTRTAADGTYSFAGLSAGTYSLSRVAPSFYDNGANLPGTVGGALDGNASANAIDQIKLNGGDAGLNYNFAEMLIP